jgi:hypothetical protein
LPIQRPWNCGAKPGDLVAIYGGGLGHLGIQYAARRGFRTVAVNRGRDKEALARSLGAHDYIDSEVGDPAQALQSTWKTRFCSVRRGTTKSLLPVSEHRKGGFGRGQGLEGKTLDQAWAEVTTPGTLAHKAVEDHINGRPETALSGAGEVTEKARNASGSR